VRHEGVRVASVLPGSVNTDSGGPARPPAAWKLAPEDVAMAVTDLLAVDVAILTHGYVAGSLIYIQGTTYYDGMRKILSLPDANSIVIAAPGGYTAEKPAGTELFFPGVSYKTDWEFLGFELHLSAAWATSEDLTVTRDALAGSGFDTLLYTRNMNGVQDIVYRFDPAKIMRAGDVAKFAWANANSRTWGLTILARPAV